jgi:long-chain acyl-CoA synthetase
MTLQAQSLYNKNSCISNQDHTRFERHYRLLFEDGKFMFAGTLLQRAAKKFPQLTALICKDISMTFEQLYIHSLSITHNLIKSGVKPGDKVCLLYENSIPYYQAYYGIWQTGAVVVPLNTFLAEHELEHILKDCEPQAIIVSPEFKKKFKPEFFATTSVIELPDDETATCQVTLKPEYASYTVPYRQPDELAALLYTSGTTGFPKGVMLSSRNILTNVVQIVTSIKVSCDDRLLGVLPLFHSFAQNMSIWSTTFLGAKTIILPKIERKWIIDGLKHKPTIIIAVPALYALLCLLRNLDLSSVRYFACGGDALPDKIRALFEMVYQRKLCNGYGLTETSPFISADLDDVLKETNTVGKVGYGIQCSLRDEQEEEVPHGQIGILWLKGDNIMLGYHKAPEATAAVLKNGWLNTGDFAYFDSEQRLVIAGRYKDLIINKGINIYPQEIENCIMNFPGILKVAVIGIPDEQTGEMPIAYLVTNAPSPTLEHTLKEHCMKNLAAYKVPREFYFLEDLPMTPLGKIDKKNLKKMYASTKHTV